MASSYYRNPEPVAYQDEILAPVPGWGMTPNLAGDPVIGIGDATPTNWYTVVNGKRVLSDSGYVEFVTYLANNGLESILENPIVLAQKLPSGWGYKAGDASKFPSGVEINEPGTGSDKLSLAQDLVGYFGVQPPSTPLPAPQGESKKGLKPVQWAMIIGGSVLAISMLYILSQPSRSMAVANKRGGR